MPVSGLKITLADDESAALSSMAALGSDPRVDLGVRSGRCVAAVLDTPRAEDDKPALRWISDLPGVAHVDVVFVSIDNPQEKVIQ